MDIETARARFGELRTQRDVSTAELDEIWAALETVDSIDILGVWKGDGFHTGHKMNGMLAAARWYGKTFDSIDDVSPIVCVDDDGNRYANTELAKGAASLWNVEFRGEVTATMVYDGQPVFDHFKRVDDHTLMGIMNGKRQRRTGSYYYFLLERP